MEFVRRPDVASRVLIAAGLASAFLACAAHAASDGQHREHDSHEHGHGTLDIVVEGEELAIEFRIPAVNAVGFEHAPRNDAERAAVRKALVPFGDAKSVLALPAAAKCEIEEAKAAIGSMTPDDDHEADRHGSGDGHDHESERQEKKAHEAHDTESAAEAHSELHASYRFHCHAAAKLDRIGVRVFGHLQGAEEIDVRIVTPSGQFATELHPGETVVKLAP